MIGIHRSLVSVVSVRATPRKLFVIYIIFFPAKQNWRASFDYTRIHYSYYILYIHTLYFFSTTRSISIVRVLVLLFVFLLRNYIMLVVRVVFVLTSYSYYYS